jgi:DNA-damage-inducible protein J
MEKVICQPLTMDANCSYIEVTFKGFRMLATDNVRARIDPKTKAAASAALAAMGLSVSDAIRMMLRRVADEKRLPFDVKVPNADSKAAIKELESGKGKTFKSADALFDDLGI